MKNTITKPQQNKEGTYEKERPLSLDPHPIHSISPKITIKR
jgi:hypothetical protein